VIRFLFLLCLFYSFHIYTCFTMASWGTEPPEVVEAPSEVATRREVASEASATLGWSQNPKLTRPWKNGSILFFWGNDDQVVIYIYNIYVYLKVNLAFSDKHPHETTEPNRVYRVHQCDFIMAPWPWTVILLQDAAIHFVVSLYIFVLVYQTSSNRTGSVSGRRISDHFRPDSKPMGPMDVGHIPADLPDLPDLRDLPDPAPPVGSSGCEMLNWVEPIGNMKEW
jgi:hypothetical protein